MIIRMLKDYFAHRAGAVVELGGGVADQLIRRGFAVQHKAKQQRRETGTSKRKRNAKPIAEH